MKTDYDHSIHSNSSADAWAKFYCETFPDADLDLMRSWFANAMMAMHDHLYQTKIKNLEDEIKILKGNSYVKKIIDFVIPEKIEEPIDPNCTCDNIEIPCKVHGYHEVECECGENISAPKLALPIYKITCKYCLRTYVGVPNSLSGHWEEEKIK